MCVCVCVWPVSVILFICWWKSQGSEEPDSEKHSLLFCFLKERSKSELLVDSGDRVEWTCLTLLTLCSGPFMCETPQCVSSSALYVWERQLHLCFSCCFFSDSEVKQFLLQLFCKGRVLREVCGRVHLLFCLPSLWIHFQELNRLKRMTGFTAVLTRFFSKELWADPNPPPAALVFPSPVTLSWLYLNWP